MKPIPSRIFLYYPATLLKGERVSKYLNQYNRFQYLDADSIRDYKTKQISSILNYAYYNTYFYRKLFDRHHVQPSDFRDFEDLKKFPLITKQDIVESASELVSSSRFFQRAFWSKKTTGGSTGQAVTVYKNPAALARERAATLRSYQWAGLPVGAAQARFWGIPLLKMDQKKYQLIDFLANRKRFSAFAISDDNFLYFHKKLMVFNPLYLYGYASVIAEYADFLIRFRLAPPPSTIAVITTSEVLTEPLRNTIKAGTGLPVFNEYGCGEVGSIAHECEHGNLHLMEENLAVEILPLDNTDSFADEGELVVTDLHNCAMPLLRYRLGDFGAVPNNESCPCGRSLKIVRKIHGRAYDILLDQAGRKVHPEFIMYLFEYVKDTFGGVKQFQVIQESGSKIEIKILKDVNYSQEIEDYLNQALKERFGQESTICFTYVDSIPREPSGKLRLIKSIQH